MAWFAPFSFIAGDSLTADQLNQYLYYNMQETLAGKANAGLLPGGNAVWLSTSGVNSIVGRKIVTDDSAGLGFRFSTSIFRTF